LSVYKINKDSTFKIKDSYYTISDLLDGNEIYKDYINGLCLIFRLSVDDYHRYCYIDNGNKSKNTFIKGELHTVQPIALEKYNIYKRNSRVYTILHTENFNDVIQVEVGALIVGKIVNYLQEYSFKKGEEKGMFEFGGSTIVLLVKENIVNIDEEIIENTMRGLETIVKYGERIGVKYERETKRNKL
jgi:phosphatidylserine decarboxylase